MAESISELNMDTSVFCRGCLMEYGAMKNMVEHGLLEDFYKFGDIEASDQNRLSELLCASCEDTLLECRRFRAQCQQSDSILKSNATLNKSATQNSGHGVTGESIGVEKQENSVSTMLYDKRLVVTITAPDTSAKIALPCPFRCAETFAKKPELLTHMLRKHDAPKDFAVELEYCCPVANCSYHPDTGGKRFSGRKFLNQHLSKVHGAEARTCEHCQLRFPTGGAFTRHLDTCNITYECNVCDRQFKTNERLLVHLMRRHPLLHQRYKMERRAERRSKRAGARTELDYICDSPKRTSATQTLALEGIRNDVALPSWPEEAKTDEISTQTALELRSQGSDEDSYFQEAVPLADIQTQTFPVEFGLARSNKETITSQTQSPDLSIKETQTCCCMYESPKFGARLFDSVSSSPVLSLTSTETQTAGFGTKIDALLGFSSAETQTSFEELLDEDPL
ncbi:unnamed protein product, partial [Iphiclides podalirius]